MISSRLIEIIINSIHVSNQKEQKIVEGIVFMMSRRRYL